PRPIWDLSVAAGDNREAHQEWIASIPDLEAAPTPSRSAKVFASCKSLPKYCKEGFPLAVRKQKISLFDTTAMISKDVVIKRYRGSSAFIDAMIASGTNIS